MDNELLSDGTWNYSYDAEGNTVQKVNISHGRDVDLRLRPQQPNGHRAVDRKADGTLIQEATYVYDALGNRIQEAVTADGVTTTDELRFRRGRQRLGRPRRQ